MLKALAREAPPGAARELLERVGNIIWSTILVYASIGTPDRQVVLDFLQAHRHTYLSGINPAARRLGIGWVNWQVLRRSCATWMQQAGMDVKDAQGLMRHSRASTTQDICQQVVPESQRKAVKTLTAFVEAVRTVQ